VGLNGKEKAGMTEYMGANGRKKAGMTGHMSLNGRKMSRYDRTYRPKRAGMKRHTRKNEEDRKTNKNREICGTD
jgi:hypothetical protein